jgi:ketosteroid isomerase-like protein
MTDFTPLDAARRYIHLLSSGAGPDELAELFDPDVIQEEFPNRLLPNGATRDLKAIREARLRGKALLGAERFELLNAFGSGDQVVMELQWSGTIAVDAGPFKSGQQLRARFAVFLEFKGGRIVRQRNYDCFDPW